MSTFTGVGVGPGDRSLITLKAVEAIKDSDVVVVPVKREGAESVALNIAKEHIGEGTDVEKLLFPMVRDEDKLKREWQKGVEKVTELLDKGLEVVFLTIGDPMLYSTCWYVLKDIKARGYKTAVVPGITSFSAAAATLQTPLAMGDEAFTVVPVTPGQKSLKEGVRNYAFLKVSSDYEALREELKEEKLIERSRLIIECGKSKEEIVDNLNNRGDEIPYLSLILTGGDNQ